MSAQKDKYKIAAVQDSPVYLDKQKSTEKACELIMEAGDNGASIAVFPETFISAYPDWVWTVPPANKKLMGEMFTALYDSALKMPDETVTKLCEAAKNAGVFVVIGANEINSDASSASIYNSMLYISPEGKLLGVHRKLIPTGGERLMWVGGDGSSLLSFDSEFGKIGGLICWENYMPLARFAMYSAGVQIYAAPTWDSSESWHTAMRHLAREGGMFVVGCAQAIRVDDIPDKYEFKKLYAEDREWINKGNSCIVDPKGEVLAGPLNAEKGIVYADVDLREIPNQKWMFDVAGHYNRPDVFDYKVNK